jgi:hypothetical protein
MDNGCTRHHASWHLKTGMLPVSVHSMPDQHPPGRVIDLCDFVPKWLLSGHPQSLVQAERKRRLGLESAGSEPHGKAPHFQAGVARRPTFRGSPVDGNSCQLLPMAIRLGVCHPPRPPWGGGSHARMTFLPIDHPIDGLADAFDPFPASGHPGDPPGDVVPWVLSVWTAYLQMLLTFQDGFCIWQCTSGSRIGLRSQTICEMVFPFGNAAMPLFEIAIASRNEVGKDGEGALPRSGWKAAPTVNSPSPRWRCHRPRNVPALRQSAGPSLR